MRMKTGRFYEFGEFRLEPEERLFMRSGQPVSLAPKAFDLLTFLVQNHGRLVTKDEIMQVVWSGSFVEDANLTVSISVLRKVFGEKEGGLQHIETIPKKGYRFVAPVREGDSQFEPERSPGLTTVSSPGPIPELEQFAVSLDALTPEQRSDHAMLSGPQPNATGQVSEVGSQPKIAINQEHSLYRSATLPGATPLIWAKRLAPAVLLILLVALAGILWRLYFRSPSLLPTSRNPQSLAILPLHNSGQDSSSDFLGFSLADVLITKLAYVSSLSVRPSAAIEKYRGTSIDLQKVATDLKVDTVLTGSYVRDGDNLRITYQLVDAKTERILGQGVIDLKYDNLLTVQDKVTSQLISELQITLSPLEAERLKPEKPVNPLAYEYFLQGLDFHGQHKFPLAIKMLEKSTEIDSTYAPAWAYLGASYNSDAAFELGGREQYRRAEAAYERALALRPNLLDAQIFLANLLVDTGKVEQAVPLLRDALKTNGNDAAAHWELGYAYRFAGMLEESVAECERARQLDPLVKANGSMLNTYLYLGQYQKFLESLPVDDSSFILFYRGFGEFYEKEFDRASRDFDRAYELEPTLYTGIGKAFSDSIHQRAPQGLVLLSGLESKMKERGVGDPEAAYKIAQAYAVLGDKISAMRVLRLSVQSGFFCYPYIAKDPLLSGLHGMLEFNEILSTARQRHEAFRALFFS